MTGDALKWKMTLPQVRIGKIKLRSALDKHFVRLNYEFNFSVLLIPSLSSKLNRQAFH